MATFTTKLVIPRPLAATFAFVTDFRNAPLWDPHTCAAQQVTPGPVGLHTKFLLRGGLLGQQTLERLHVPNALRPSMALPYEVVAFVPEHEMVIRGETALLRYEDHLLFAAEGDSTQLRYTATMALKGVLAVGNPLLQPLLAMLGAAATRDLPAAVAAALPFPPPTLTWPTSPLVNPDDVRRVVALDAQPLLRNLLITQGYHDVSQMLRARTGGVDINWCTLGSWASKTAGRFIRDEQLPAVFRHLLAGSGPCRRALDAMQRSLSQDTAAPPCDVLAIVRAILHDCATYIMTGNTIVYAELAQCCTDFVHTLGGDRVPDSAKLAAFQARYTEGAPEPDAVAWGPQRTLIFQAQGGQGLLRGMVGHLYQAMFETDPKKRAEHMLFANAQGGLHEQTRLQPYIVGGLNAPIAHTLLAWAHHHVDSATPEAGRGHLHTAIDVQLPGLGRLIEDAWQYFATDALMTLTLPDGVLHLGDPIPQEPGTPLLPPVLETIADPALAALLDRYDALRLDRQPSVGDWLKHRLCALLEGHAVDAGALVDVEALNWTDFEQRMRYILTLFRLRQQDADLFQPPFTEAQQAALFAGRIPPGTL